MCLHIHVYCGNFHHNQEIDSTKVFIGRWMDKQNVLYVHNSVILKEEEITSLVENWVEWEITMLNEISHFERQHHLFFSLRTGLFTHIYSITIGELFKKSLAGEQTKDCVGKGTCSYSNKMIFWNPFSLYKAHVLINYNENFKSSRENDRCIAQRKRRVFMLQIVKVSRTKPYFPILTVANRSEYCHL